MIALKILFQRKKVETKIRKVLIQLNDTELLKESNPFSTNVPHLYFYKNGILVEIVSMVNSHCVKSVYIRSYSSLHFPAFGLNTERYSVSPRMQSECGKIRTRKNTNMDTFHEVCGLLKKSLMENFIFCTVS